jgi:hypothetical protein
MTAVPAVPVQVTAVQAAYGTGGAAAAPVSMKSGPAAQVHQAALV